MRVSKTVRAELFGLTKSKLEKLEDLRREWERALDMERDYRALRKSTRLPSYFCRALAWKVGKGHRSPILLDRDSFKVVEAGRKFARFFVSVPTPQGRVWCPLRMAKRHEELLPSVEIRDSRLVCRKGRFFLHLVVEKEVAVMRPSGVLAVDLGERFLAASVALSMEARINSARLHGRDARGIRRHYAWLRRRLGERKLLRVIKRIGRKERRRMDDLCHRISRAIVDEAKKQRVVIVIGDLRGIRRRDRGRRLNRIVSNMPYHRLSRYIEYKALWEGVPVVFAGEAYTSRVCHRCGSEVERPYQGLVRCQACGLEYNADLNGAINIGKRFLDHWSGNGAVRLSALEGDLEPPSTGPLKG